MRNSIYLSENPVEFKADLLLEFDKDFDEIWCHVPCSEKRYSDLASICENVSKKFDSPDALGVLYYFDVLGNPCTVFKNGCLSKGLKVSHNFGTFFISLPSWKRNYEHSEFMECAAELMREMEKAYGSAWFVDMKKRSDSLYVRFGFNDDVKTDSDFLDPEIVMRGNDIKFLCDCGQFKNRKSFKSKCDFALGADGCVGLGFYYNDIKLGCHDYVSAGDNRFFRNMGYVDRGYVSDRHSGYSYYVRARNLDEKKVNVLPRLGCSSEKIYEPARAFSSVEEFALERAAAGGLRLGDACYLYCVATDPDGEKRSISCTACWDGSKWIDYYRETEIKDWPELEPGWSLSR